MTGVADVATLVRIGVQVIRLVEANTMYVLPMGSDTANPKPPEVIPSPPPDDVKRVITGFVTITEAATLVTEPNEFDTNTV